MTLISGAARFVSQSLTQITEKIASKFEKPFADSDKFIRDNHTFTDMSETMEKGNIMSRAEGTASRVSQNLNQNKEALLQKTSSTGGEIKFKANNNPLVRLKNSFINIFNSSIKPKFTSKSASLESTPLEFTKPTSKALAKQGLTGLALLRQNKLPATQQHEGEARTGASITKTDASKGHGGIKTLADKCEKDTDKFLQELNGYAKIVYTAGGKDQFLEDIQRSDIKLSPEQENSLLDKTIFLGGSEQTSESQSASGLPDTFKDFKTYGSFASFHSKDDLESSLNHTVGLLKQGAQDAQDAIKEHGEKAVLIMCNQGQNRSSSLNIMHEMEHNGKNFEEAYQHVMGQRSKDLDCTVKDYLILSLQYHDIQKQYSDSPEKAKTEFAKVLIDLAATDGIYVNDKVTNLIENYAKDPNVKAEMSKHMAKIDEKAVANLKVGLRESEQRGIDMGITNLKKILE